MKVAHVLVVYFGGRRAMYCSPTTPDQVLDCIKKQVELAQVLDPGIDCDLILINNNGMWGPGEEYLESVNGLELPRGRIRVFHRPNNGGSFGGFGYAYGHLASEYSHFIFSEDDLFIYKSNIAKECVDYLEARPDIGYVALGPIVHMGNLSHVGGGFGCVKTEILHQVAAKNKGSLPCPRFNNYDSIEWEGEVPFTNQILKLGLNFDPLPNRASWTRNWREHPHCSLAQKQGIDLTHFTEEHFFYSVGTVPTNWRELNAGME